MRLYDCSTCTQVKRDHIQIPGLAVPGLLLLVAGLIGIATNGQVASRQNHRQASACPSLLWTRTLPPLARNVSVLTPLGVQAPALQWPTRKTRMRATRRRLVQVSKTPRTSQAVCLHSRQAFLAVPSRTLHARPQLIHCLTTISSPCGLIPFCASTGLLLAPQTWAPANVQGVNYVPSIAAGVLISAPIVNGALLAAGREPLALKPHAAALPGICAGVAWWARVPATLLSALYTGLCEGVCLAFVCAESAEVELNRCDECRNAGNVLSILAVNDPNVGYAIAYPIYQVRSSIFFDVQLTLACSQLACTNKTITTWKAVNPPCTCTWPPWPKCQHLSKHMKVL